MTIKLINTKTVMFKSSTDSNNLYQEHQLNQNNRPLIVQRIYSDTPQKAVRSNATIQTNVHY